MFKAFKNLSFLSLFFLINSCGVTEYVTGSDDSEPELTSNIDLELKSDDDKEIKEMIENQRSLEKEGVQENNEDSITLTESNERLDSAPTKEYDSALIDSNENEVRKEETINSETTRKVDFPEFEKLKLKNKIQYRIATINFSSGSSVVSYKGLKKIKRIVNLAKERDAMIKIVGHASKRTKDMPLDEHKLVNFNISHKRAQSVAKLVVDKYNFPSSNLLTEAVSDSKPLFREDMPAGTKANQRTEIFIIY